MRHCVSLGTVAFALLLAGSATAQAAPPANDDYGNATTISGKLPVQVSGTNVDATKQAGEPDHGGDAGGASVWYRWTAPATGPVQIHTCNGPQLDTLLSVYTETGAVPPFSNLHEEVGNDDLCANGIGLAHSSLVELNAAAGTIYEIAVDSFSGGVGPPETGPFALRISADVPTVAIDSGPGTTSDSTPTWMFRTFGANSPVTISCTIFKEFPDQSGLFVAYLEQPACSSPFTPGTLLPLGNYELDVVATAATGESSLESGLRAFTIVPPPDLTPTPSPQTPTRKKCKKGQHLKHGKCVKKRKKGKKRR